MALPVAFAVATSAGVACSDDQTSFEPSARVIPGALDFGEVAVNQRKTLDISFESDGSALYRLVEVNLDGDSSAFEVQVAPELQGDGIPAGVTAFVEVTYTPCPAAWDGDTLRDDFDFDANCPDAPINAGLDITDNSAEPSRRIPLAGVPVLPPSATLVCALECGATRADVPCSTLLFGQVDGSLDQPCDIPLALQNRRRGQRSVGTLVVDDAVIRVRDVNVGTITDGAHAGFELLDANKNPITVSPGQPLVVPVDAGSVEGSVQLYARFRGTVPGTWRGERRPDADDGTGLRLRSNDPDNLIVAASILAVGVAPDISANPSFFNFEEVATGETETATITVRNDGDSPLQVTNIAILNGSSEFGWTSDRGSNFPITLDPLTSFRIFVSFSPVNAGFDFDFLRIASTDPDEPNFDVEVRGGAAPQIQVNPPDILVFPLSLEPPRVRSVEVCNIGGAPLTIAELDFEALDMGAADDFAIIEPSCPVVPCTPNLVVCSPNQVSCTDNCTDIRIQYSNNDQSSVDELNLVIKNDDLGDQNRRVALRAEDVPCGFPRPVIEVVTPDPCVGQPVTVSAQMSEAGGRSGENDQITTYEWEWLFARPPVPTFDPTAGQTAGQAVSFTAERSGTYILGLNVQNTCGQRSQSAATESIVVSSSCP